MPATGIGFDCHRFAEGRRLVLGGVVIPHDKGLDGHSDADVLTHAIIDALLGAAAMGDIGELYPDTDERFRDADSMDLLADTVRRLGEASMTIRNVDATVMLERPKLAEHKAAIRRRLATVLGLEDGRVNIKATTAEGMGALGRSEGVAALAVAVIEDFSQEIV